MEPTPPTPPAAELAEGAPKPGLTELRYTHSNNLVDLLEQLQVTLLVSTYQAGKLVVVGAREGKIQFSFHGFDQIMGLAVSPRRIAVGTRRQIWFLERAPELGPQIEPAGQYDACYLTRLAHYTGPLQIHELGWGREELWLVNTLFSCLSTLDATTSFVPRWKPPFISALADQDRCHLNSMARVDGRPRYVTALAETDTAAGWREDKAKTGCILSAPDGRVVTRGLSMPHSVRVHEGRLWVLDSGYGRLSLVDPQSGATQPVALLPGYTRGLAFFGPFAFIGQSRIRETNVFGGLPIGEHADQLQCGVSVVDVRNGRRIAHLTFETGVEEIFDVQLLPGVRMPAILGPDPERDEQNHVWLAAQPRWWSGD